MKDTGLIYHQKRKILFNPYYK
ncbi:hypothetical protein PFNF135_06164 [Plasmodium falciparum NF135/5.C10]|uniref:Uncharacterized protein n=1 Tax=Plasmodium falciparum NF135/5.C10 TaxID=1036726 RepID=W4I6V7_PLAFA|nr:hypothetical protein PFNF135_06164 [Plasmodium falciparum NF135/5.C10]